NSAWLVSIIRGIIIMGVMIIAAPFVVGFFNTPDATTLLYIMSLVPLIRGFINPAVVKLQKELLFKTEFFFRSVVLIIEIAATIVLLVINPSPSSLIWGLVVGALCEMTLSYIIISPRPRFHYNKGYISELIHHGKWITGATIFNYGFERGDNIVVGRILGSQALGIYDMAYRFSMLPITEIAEIVNKVAFPVYVKISDDYLRLKRAFLRTIGMISLFVLIVGLTLFFFTEPIVRIILGERWLETVEVLQVLAILGIVRAISLSISSFLLALRKQKYLTLTTFIGLAGMLTTIVPAITMWGIVGAAYAACFGYILSVPFIIYFAWTSLEAVRTSKHHV
ncbi:MAG TPA: oligosaccharide flippase family protein, partial [Candidatus Levybacteria bacterium]|nr:oligosaccharide flippase family protein [Candidatus Levybacteria bacterium]